MSPNLLDNPQVRSFLKDKFLCSVDTHEKRVALTFDDGPNPTHTPALLEVLAKHNVKATFFLLGRYVKQFPHLVEETLAEGHELGNHGYWHAPLPLLPPSLRAKEVSDAEQLISDIAGYRPRWYRPAMGWFNKQVLSYLVSRDYQPVLGNIHPRDSGRPGSRAILDRVLDRIEPGSIVILHDGGWSPRVNRGQTVEAVAKLIPMLLDRGYRFETVGSLSGQNAKDYSSAEVTSGASGSEAAPTSGFEPPPTQGASAENPVP
ncbi:MAG: polysaccharide deacetylase family protein [Candidatus Eisenbacteria bacterium]|uniref:Polysaccharide deacetylase family protein n=1 Tax=Eiseniibacteriota bacterium TaxID=2212470 RepID=A0A7Y2ECV5_UNCEI|nr:polysaccharide deacetylase family protein [Candidatus Eisenbacteria bacterium]